MQAKRIFELLLSIYERYNNMEKLVLGIESSCDETAASVLQWDGRQAKVLSERISSQNHRHENYGGVVPELASREHLTNLPIIVSNALKDASVSAEGIQLVAATRGPGLQGCLFMGYSFAKGFALAGDIPFIGVNHIEGHILVPLLDNPELTFPYLCLVVSGGHTEIHIVRDVGNYECLGRKIDDAAGEAFDKSARLLGLPYPGGPHLAKQADTVSSSRFSLPKVMRGENGFSFSGLKTAIRLLVEKQKLNSETIPEIAYTIQEAIVDTLLFKVNEAVKITGIQSIVTTGGVAANRRLREALGGIQGCKAYFPTNFHSTDNATMIGFVGALRHERGEVTDYDSEVRSRWLVEDIGGGN